MSTSVIIDVLIVSSYIGLQVWVVVFVSVWLEYKRQRALPHYISHMKAPVNYLPKHSKQLIYTKSVRPISVHAMFPDLNELADEQRQAVRQQYKSHDAERVTIQIDPDHKVTQESGQSTNQNKVAS